MSIKKTYNFSASDLLLVGGRSVLVEGGQVGLLLRGAQRDGLCVALDGVLILPSLEVFVAFILRCLGAVQRALSERGKETVSSEPGLSPGGFTRTRNLTWCRGAYMKVKQNEMKHR